MEAEVIELIACPVCLGRLAFRGAEWLECSECGRRYPVEDGVPVLLEDRSVRD